MKDEISQVCIGDGRLWGVEGNCVSISSAGYKIKRDRGGGVGEEGEFCPLLFLDHQATNTTATPAVISSDPVFCLFE